MTNEEKIELVKRAQQGDREAEATLITAHHRYIYFFAKKYSPQFGKIVTTEYLANEGMFGFIRAIRNFDTTRKTKFTAYARHYIRKYIFKEIEACRLFTQCRLEDLSANLTSYRDQKEYEVDINQYTSLLLDQLDRRSARIVRLLYGLDGEHPLAIKDIAQMTNLSAERVRQVAIQALERLKVFLEDNSYH